jgi:hypothetical protein
MPGVSGAALSGFDQVAFFTDKMPVNSNIEIASMHKGVAYYFKNKGHKKLFETGSLEGACVLEAILVSLSGKAQWFEIPNVWTWLQTSTTLYTFYTFLPLQSNDIITII